MPRLDPQLTMTANFCGDGVLPQKSPRHHKARRRSPSSAAPAAALIVLTPCLAGLSGPEQEQWLQPRSINRRLSGADNHGRFLLVPSKMAVSWKRLLVLFCAVMLCLILCSSIDVGGDHLQLQGWGWGKKKGHKHKKYNHKKHKKHKKHKHKEHEHEEYEHEEHEHKKLKRKKIKFRLPLFRRKKSKGSYSMSPKKKRSRFNLLHKIRRHLKGKRKKRHKYKRKHYDTEDDDDYRAMDEMDEMEGGRNKRLSKNQLQGLKKAKGLIKKLTMGKHDKKVLEREMAKAAHSSGADTVKHLKKAESIMEKDENYDPWPRVNHTLHELILKVQ